MLRIHLLQQFFGLSDPAAEEMLYDMPLYREFARIDAGCDRLPDEVEHPFRVLKRQFGHAKVRYRGLAKNTSQLVVMFAMSNLWMVRKALIAGQQKRASTGVVRPQAA